MKINLHGRRRARVVEMLYNERNRQKVGDWMQTTKQFLETFVCKAGETVVQVNESEWEIQKRTTYTFRTLGNVYAVEKFDHNPAVAILNLKLSPKARREKLTISRRFIQEALEKGWLIEEVRFKNDGRTAASIHYRMGPGLWQYEQGKLQEAERKAAKLKAAIYDEAEKLKDVLPKGFFNGLELFRTEPKDSEGWGKERRQKFAHFLIAYLQLRNEKSRMDFKEIGATYYREIGGSKAFDHYREPFIARLEKWIEAPIQEIGILSLGFITPVHFTGHLKGNYAQYEIGTVHTTNDIAVAKDNFQSNADTLWLVENRAVLTRMATEIDFIKETNAFILGVDGQIGGAHRKLIQQLCAGNRIKKVMIWVDYDRAGRGIAQDLVAVIGTLPYRLIGNENNVFSTYDAYLSWAKTVSDAEQEMTLGGEANWRKWLEK